VFLRVSFVLAALGVLLAVLDTALVTSRASTDRARLDRGLATAAGEKAALVDTAHRAQPWYPLKMCEKSYGFCLMLVHL
jgi:hypothetical protein